MIPGPVLTVTNADGSTRELDCRVETCGIITFGAHGVTNANNETFTPITFTDATAVVPATPEASEEPTAEVATAEASASADGEEGTSSSAAPWVIAGTTGAAAIAAAGSAFVVQRRKRNDLASGATSETTTKVE